MPAGPEFDPDTGVFRWVPTPDQSERVYHIGAHALALKADGAIESWGGVGYGADIPPGLSRVAAISAGFQHSLALLVSPEPIWPTDLGCIEGVFHLSLPTKRGKTYFLESCDALSQGSGDCTMA